MTNGEIIGAVVAILVPMFIGFATLIWKLSRMDARMMTRKDLRAALKDHRESCEGSPFYTGREVTGVHAVPPPLPPGR